MTIRQSNGELGEKEVCEKIPCPNCGGKLFQLIKNNPLNDVACNSCLFRAQVKTSTNTNPTTVNGAGWDILNKTLKFGIIIPQLIVNLNNEIRYYPYIPKTALKKRIANINNHNGTIRKYPMFDYYIKGLKYYILLEKK